MRLKKINAGNIPHSATWHAKRMNVKNENLLKYFDMVSDNRQEKKVQHKMSDIIALVFFAMLGNANEWAATEILGKEHEKFLRKYLELANGIPSHDTIQRVFAMVSPESLQKVQKQWNELLSSGEGEKIKRQWKKLVAASKSTLLHYPMAVRITPTVISNIPIPPSILIFS